MVLAINERNFSQEVLDTSVPVLVNFWAPWCSVCRMINPFLTKFQAEWDGNIKLVSINADENLKLANTYRLTTLPTVLVIKSGKVLYRLDRFRSRDDLRRAAEDLRGVLREEEIEYRYTA